MKYVNDIRSISADANYKDPAIPYRAQKRIGWKNEWHIVNAMGGLVSEFTGTKAQALAQAHALESARTLGSADAGTPKL